MKTEGFTMFLDGISVLTKIPQCECKIFLQCDERGRLHGITNAEADKSKVGYFYYGWGIVRKD